MNTFELDSKYVANTYRRFPVEIVSGKGAVAYDVNGKKYVSGSESLWRAFTDIRDELASDGDNDPISLTFYRE